MAKALDHGQIVSSSDTSCKETLSAILIACERKAFVRQCIERYSPRPGIITATASPTGLEVAGLKRNRIGRVVLGDLPAGQWRYLREDEAF
jgi:hypothetical protein